MHACQHASNFVFGEHSGQMLGAFGAQGMDWRIQLDVQHVAVEEQQGIESLVLSGSRYIFILRQVCEKGFNFRYAHFCRVAHMIEEDISLCPKDVGFFSGIRIMFDADSVTQLVEKFFGLCRRIGGYRVRGFWSLCYNEIKLNMVEGYHPADNLAVMQYIIPIIPCYTANSPYSTSP